MSKHTKGPWKVWNSGYANSPNVIYFGPHSPRLNRDGLLTMPTAEGGTIAEVRTDESPTRTELEANARLIAAAPDLYEVLVGVTSYLSETISASKSPKADGQVLMMLNEVLKKAEGRS